MNSHTEHVKITGRCLLGWHRPPYKKLLHIQPLHMNEHFILPQKLCREPGLFIIYYECFFLYTNTVYLLTLFSHLDSFYKSTWHLFIKWIRSVSNRRRHNKAYLRQSPLVFNRTGTLQPSFSSSYNIKSSCSHLCHINDALMSEYATTVTKITEV